VSALPTVDNWDRVELEQRRTDDRYHLELTTVLYRQRLAVVTTWRNTVAWTTDDPVAFAYTAVYLMHDPDDEWHWDHIGGKLYALPVSRGGLEEAHAWMVDRRRRGDVPGRW
jgi:hypothetical protein